MKELKKKPTWVCWKYVTKAGRKTKVPYAVTGRQTGTSPDHSNEWTDFAAAATAQKKLDIDGIGFVMPSGYFLLDVDHRDVDDPIMEELTSLFPTYLEHSPSGHGFHFYGRVDASQY